MILSLTIISDGIQYLPPKENAFLQESQDYNGSNDRAKESGLQEGFLDQLLQIQRHMPAMQKDNQLWRCTSQQ